MLEIKVEGNNQTGKTQKLIALANNTRGKVLFVCFSVKEARRLESSGKAAPNVKFIGPHIFLDAIKRNAFEAIIFDNLDMFPNLGFSWIYYAKSRLIGEFCFMAYSLGKAVNIIEEWVSTAIWYMPWTWKDGHFVRRLVRKEEAE